MRNNEVVQEVADVLNMRMASLDSWTWTGDSDGTSATSWTTSLFRINSFRMAVFSSPRRSVLSSAREVLPQ
jgi:hypothetical protein